MATFLAIYSKIKQFETKLIDSILADFSLNGSRNIINKEFSGFQLFFVDKFQKYFFENETSLSFVSGHVSFDKLGGKRNLGLAEQFNAVFSTHEIYCLEQLEGAFAFIHYNKITHTLSYANDKFGMFPLFVYEDKNYTVLCNEYQPLTHFSKQLDKEAIVAFLTFGVTLGNTTFFKHIKNLAPATVVVTNKKQTNKTNYWNVKTNLLSDKSIDALTEDMFSLFQKINQESINANVTQLNLLTAGADSRLIVSTLTKEQLNKLKFYTSNLSFLDPLEDKDVVGASAIAAKFNLQHQVEKISFYENSFDTSYYEKERELREKQVYGGWHGGEFLGGFCLNAAPINKKLKYEEVDKKYKSIFNWWFRVTQNKHPFTTYKQELEKLNNNHFLFMIHQMTRSFFSNIYGGTRGHWVQPFQLMNHGFSPFWDSRFLQLILQIPIKELKNYNFYNQVLKHTDKAFTEISSNSPLTNREDSIIPIMNNAIEPKKQIPNTHHKAYKDCLSNDSIWKRGVYNQKELKKILENEFDTTTKQWLDFEVWYSKYIK